jgi:predicted outer membrane repeat protein
MNRFNSSRSRYIALTGLALLCAPALSHAANRNVPAVYPNIQEAINASVNGDTVLVSPGVYSGPGNVNLDPAGKAITIKSASGPGSCTLDGGNANQIFLIHSGETTKTIVSGFTLQRGFGYNGGAICITSSSPTILNCVFKNNQATNGGGCYAALDPANTLKPANAPSFSNCTFVHNQAGNGNEPVPSGGGLMLVGGAGVISNCVFASNVASPPGGDISNGGGLMLQSDKTKVSNCAFNNNASWNGGGAQADQNSLATFTNCTFNANTGWGNGGGADVTGGANPVFNNCAFTNNYGAFAGGLASFSGLGVKVSGCVFDSNITDYLGAGLGAWSGILNVVNCTFSNNTAPNGAGIWTQSSGETTIVNSTFDSNSAGDLGGGLYAQGSNPTVTGCLFTNNSATMSTYATGGGAYCSGSPTFIGCLFDGNVANYGAGLATGGWKASNKSVVVNTVFENNTATYMAGGIHVEGDTAIITQCTFSGNLVSSQAGNGDGIACQAYFTLTISDTILWDTGRGAAGSDFNTDASGAATFQYSDVYGGAPGVDNLNVDPQFTDPANGDLWLQATSPCLKAGSTKVPNYSGVDVEGTRRNAKTPTMGAYEN